MLAQNSEGVLVRQSEPWSCQRKSRKTSHMK